MAEHYVPSAKSAYFVKPLIMMRTTLNQGTCLASFTKTRSIWSIVASVHAACDDSDDLATASLVRTGLINPHAGVGSC
jgi:hypothetical protein